MGRAKLACAAANFLPKRPLNFRPEAIVLHRTGWTEEQIRAKFADGATAISAHYVVTEAGVVFECVAEGDTAFHAGVVINPTWKGLKPKTNPNFYTIGIELEGTPGEPLGDEQMEACSSLLAEVAARHQIKIDEDHVVLHSEIRASRNCPGNSLNRGEVVQRALLAATSTALFPGGFEVEILKDTNLREGLPSSSVRVVSVLIKGTKLPVNGFTLKGEPVKGNSAWFQNEAGDFFWAGNSTIPDPRPEADETSAVAAPRSPEVSETDGASGASVAGDFAGCKTGISEIDQFFSSESCPPLELSKSSHDAVSAIQDLLTGQGCPKLPFLLSLDYGVLTNTTLEALRTFQNRCHISADAVLTSETMKNLVGLPASDPRATRAYFSLVLGVPFTGIHRLLAITAQMEGIGKFAALNLNTDSAGLSFGLIQWAQRPGRLFEIVSAFRAANAEEFDRIFSNGDRSLGDGLLAHLKKPFGGLLKPSGATADPQFNLIRSPWVERFQTAAMRVEFQRVQVETARQDFERSLTFLRGYDTAQLIKSERGVAFMLDVANQFGDRGLEGIYRRSFRQGMTEQDLLHAIADATVSAMPPRFAHGVRARRDLFLTTPLLSTSNIFQLTPSAGIATA